MMFRLNVRTMKWKSQILVIFEGQLSDERARISQ